MSTKNASTAIVDEIIDNASELPKECQDWILLMVKGMAFTRKCMTVSGQDDCIDATQKTGYKAH